MARVVRSNSLAKSLIENCVAILPVFLLALPLAFLLAHRRQTGSTGASYNASTVIDVNVNVNLSTGIFPNPELP
jgi:hypothetical protein